VTESDPVALSALQHWCYCPRQCGLIYLEGEFADNVHTARGQAVHHLVDTPGYEILAGVRVERALPLWSERFGLIGKADLVEFHPDGRIFRSSSNMGDDVKNGMTMSSLPVKRCALKKCSAAPLTMGLSIMPQAAGDAKWRSPRRCEGW